MTLEIPVPDPEWVLSLPGPAKLGLGLLAWYALAGAACRALLAWTRTFRPPENVWLRSMTRDAYARKEALIAWAASPLAALLYLPVYRAWAALWVVSFGLVGRPVFVPPYQAVNAFLDLMDS